MKTLDFSPASIRDRWEAGAHDMRLGLGKLGRPAPHEAFRYVTVTLAEVAAAAARTGRDPAGRNTAAQDGASLEGAGPSGSRDRDRARRGA